MNDPPELDSLTLEQALDLTLAAAEVVQRAAHGDGTDALDQEETLLRLRQLQRLRFLLSTVTASLETHAYHAGPRGKQIIEGLGQVDVRRTSDRRAWDQRGAAQVAIDHLMESHPDGDLPTPWEVAEAILEVANIGYCRTTVLRSWGIDPDQLSERVPGRPAVSLPPLD